MKAYQRCKPLSAEAAGMTLQWSRSLQSGIKRDETEVNRRKSRVVFSLASHLMDNVVRAKMPE